jgi:hypothetical protein
LQPNCRRDLSSHNLSAGLFRSFSGLFQIISQKAVLWNRDSAGAVRHEVSGF